MMSVLSYFGVPLTVVKEEATVTRALCKSIINNRMYVCWDDDMQSPILEPWHENGILVPDGFENAIVHNRLNLIEERLDAIELHDGRIDHAR